MIRNMITGMRSEVQLRWGMVSTLALVAGLLLPVSEAGAVSARVKFACANDYFAHCSQFKPDTPGVRNCMRKVGDNLSKRCIAALDAEGEVTEADKAQHVASQHDDE